MAAIALVEMIRAHCDCALDLAAVELANLASDGNFLGEATTWCERNCKTYSVGRGIR